MTRQATRRQFIHSSLATMVAAGAAPAIGGSRGQRKKLPVVGVVTVYRNNSHADVILGKILAGYDQKGGPGPALELVGMYVEQRPTNEMSQALARKYKVPVFKTIEEAVTLGGSSKKISGILSIGEHGNYPETKDTRQRMYPRRRFFDSIANGLKQRNEVVPVFNDKHLSYRWSDANHMYQTALRRKIPFMAGSSVPVTWRKPHAELDFGCEIQDAIGIGYGGPEAYGFHALEGLQCMLERRKGGETGVRSVQTLTGDAVWKAEKAGVWSRELLNAGLAAQGASTTGLKDKLSRSAPFYVIEYRDGLRATLAMMNGVAGEFGFAARIRGRAKPVSFKYDLQLSKPFGHFSWLLQGIEQMVHTGKPAYPVERTLLTTGILDRAMHSLVDKRKHDTPELAISYKPTRWSYAKTIPYLPPAS